MRCNNKLKILLILAIGTIFLPNYVIHVEADEKPLEVITEPVNTGVDLPWQLEAIAKCESSNMHFYNDGRIVMNKNTNGTVDVGRYQINSVHFKRATELGIDVYTEDGNTEFALLLYREQGTGPWYASKKCHGL